jgi:flavin reductase (DIM6/NTAB) family NADH-FMN oxidoreductase RutF
MSVAEAGEPRHAPYAPKPQATGRNVLATKEFVVNISSFDWKIFEKAAIGECRFEASCLVAQLRN